jgi:hypothetical protein
LTGTVFGVALAAVGVMRALVPLRLGQSAPYPNYGAYVDALLGLRWLTAALIGGSVGALENALFTVLIFVVLRLVLRRVWLSIAVGVALLSVVSLGNIGDGPIVVPFAIVRGALITFVVVRFGLLASAIALYVASALTAVPLTLDVSHWSATASNWTLAGIMLLTLFGFYASRAGQPLVGSVLRE